MKNLNENTSGNNKPFNTLALSGTGGKKPQITLMGKGKDLTDFKAMYRWAKRKLVTQIMALSLMEVARRNEDWKWEQRFWSTFNCQSEIITRGGRSYAILCRQRCCTICLANRKAEKINLYLPTVLEMEDPYFLTLTVQSVNKDELRMRVRDIVKAIRTIIARHKKRHQRGTEQKFYGIWALESNFNPITKTYNPHIHLILPNNYISEIIKQEWLSYWNEKKVPISIEAQYHRPVNENREQDLIEIVKYGSKIFTEPDLLKRLKETKKGGRVAFIYTAALYNILEAMDGIDVFNTFGIKLPKAKKPSKMITIADDYTEWEYNRETPDWFSFEYQGNLTNYKPPQKLHELLEYRVNNDLE